MPRALIPGLLVLAALAASGCGDDGVVGREDGAARTGPATAVTVVLDLERPPPGPPDAGTQGGHGAPDGIAEADGPRVEVRARVAPADARLTARAGRGATAEVAQDGAGGAVIRVGGLRPGTTTLRLRATATGARPWAGTVAIRRTD